MPKTPEKQWYSVTEAAEYLGISRDTLYKLMDEGRLSYYALEGVQKRRIRKEDLDALMRKVQTGKKKMAG